jgi:PKD repeat protein
MNVKISKKWTILGIITLMILVSFSGLTTGKEENIPNDSKDYTHTVLAEEPTATWCGYCPTVATYMDNIWDSYEYDWNFIALVDDMNVYADARNTELGVTGFPSVYYDGGYQVIVGAGDPQSAHEAAIDNCGARTVADIDIDLTAVWLGDNALDVDVDVINNEGSTYDGNVRVYVTENYSRWYVQTVQYRFAFIGNYAFNEDVSISAGGHWNNHVTWDGDDWGFDDLDPENLRVIVAVLDGSTDYVDESEGMEPLTNLAPTADFSYMPTYPEEMETITFTDESLDSDGSIVSWDWDFGNGDASTAQDPTYAYADEGYYTVSLTVEDDDGATATYSELLIVTNVGVLAIQPIFDRGFPVRHALDGDWAAAQSFNLSSGDVITSADVYLRKFGTPEFDLTVELRENDPEGNLIETLTFTPAEVPTSWEWFKLDFTNYTLTSGTETFIVLPPAPSGVTTSFGYEFGYAFGDMYGDGAFWFTRDGGALWRDLPDTYDYVFSVLGFTP